MMFVGELDTSVRYDIPESIDLTGQRFGMLSVEEYIPPCDRPYFGTDRRNSDQAVWACRCDCGRIVFRRGTDLRYLSKKRILNCGCVKPKLKGNKNAVGNRSRHYKQTEVV